MSFSSIRFFFFPLHIRLSFSFSHPFFSFFFSSIQQVLSFSLFFLQLSVSVCLFVFFFLHTRLSFFSFFLPHSRSALILSFLTPAFALCFFLFSFLLDSRTTVVFVKKIGGRGYYDKSSVRKFSPGFSSQFGRKKFVNPGEKIISRAFLPIFFNLPNSKKHCFPQHFPPYVFILPKFTPTKHC